ncbi:MAG: hypothetical protein WC878_03475 [Candidatus Paceibacterota bacterium]
MELKKQGFIVSRAGGDLQVGNKKVQIKCCNSDNQWAKSRNVLGGWDRIDSENFDYLICVVFDNGFDWVRYFIFPQSEVKDFPQAVWRNARTLKNLTLIKDEERTEEIVKGSENRWDKIY